MILDSLWNVKKKKKRKKGTKREKGNVRLLKVIDSALQAAEKSRTESSFPSIACPSDSMVKQTVKHSGSPLV
jgi:hypothetical protein